MKKTKKEAADSPSIKTAIIFGVIVFLLIIVALCVKMVSLIRESTYDGTHRFTIAFKKNQNTADVFSFEKATNSITAIHITSKRNVWPLEKTASIPVDAIIFSSPPDSNSVPSDLMKKLFTVSRENNNMTSYDLFRLATYARNVSPSKIKTDSITLNNQFDPKQLSDFLLDSGINQDNASITVTNASERAGLGAALDKVLTNMGCNVIMVNSSENPVEHTSISYAGKKSYTLLRIASLLQVTPTSGNTSGISDILITIGKDGFVPNLPQNKP